MARRVLASSAFVLLLVLVVPAAPAAAGGGCHDGLTQGTGDTITAADACFTPSILYVDPGATITFLNKDPFVHNVAANGWGHLDDMNEGDSFTATFPDPGVYPFACSYHPGMTGAIFVGDGMGAGSGRTVTVESLSAGSQAQPPRGGDAASGTGGGESTGAWVGGAALGFALALGLWVVTRRREEPTAG